MAAIERINTYLYVDGFNLYYGAAKNTPYKWLNPKALIESLFPQNEITAIKYCTAAISSYPGNPDAPNRQRMYWRALRTVPCTDIIQGHFRCRKKRMRAVTPPPKTVEIYNTEEKGSDVNLAAHLLMDGFRDKYEVAIVLSGDSDLITPIQMIRDQLHKPIGVVNPQLTSGLYRRREMRGSAGLKNAASFYRGSLTDNKVKEALFSSTLHDTKGTFHKPPSW